MIRHPLLRDVTIVLALKVAALTAIYFALVAPARTKVDTAHHIGGGPSSGSTAR
ncbi:MAG: cytochrome oxidase putative small subunit CydP [Pseudomonadota bacterium]